MFDFSDASTILGYQNFEWFPPNKNAAGPPPSGISPAPWTEAGSPTLYYNVIPASYTVGANPYTNSNQTTYCEVIGPVILMDDKGSHDLNLGGAASISGLPGGPCSGDLITSARTIDGSALQTSWGGTAAAIYPDGTKFFGDVAPGHPGIALEDSNGNYLTSSGIGSSGTVSDSLGRPLYTVSESAAVAGQSFAYPTKITTYTTGAPVDYLLTWGNVSYGFTFSQPTSSNITSDSANYPAMVVPGPGTGSVTVLQSIVLPDGTSYSFTYDPLYGTIQQITFPTGGHVHFDWGVRNIGDMSYYAAQGMSSLAVKHVDISHGSGVDRWTYDCPDLNVSTVQISCNVTDPQGNTTQYTGAGFGANQDPLTNSASPSFHEISRKIYSAGTLIRTINTSYGGTGGSITLPATVTTTYNDALANAPNQQQVKYVYDQYDNVIEKDESDLYTCSSGVCTPPGWLRRTLTTYYWSQYAAYRTAHIVDKPYTVTVTDGSGNPLSKSQYDYDQFALGGSLGIQNHDDSRYPASFRGPRGNMTTESHCLALSGGSCAQWATTTYHYDLTGQVVSVTDPCGNATCSDMHPTLGLAHTTTYSYDDKYTDASPLNPTNGFATRITRPQTGSFAHVDQYFYYFKTGGIYQHTDENLQVTSYSYTNQLTGAADPFNRIGKVTLPPTLDGPAGTNASGYQSYSYSDVANAYSVTQSALMTNAGNKIMTKVTAYDELGRVSSTKLTSDPEGSEETDTLYDSDGRVYAVSNPYRSISDPTYGWTFFNMYDALGRKMLQTNPDNSTKTWMYAGNLVTFTDENKSQWQQTSDGLGRLTYVVEPNGISRAPLMTTSYSYDALGNLLSVNQCGGSCPSAGSVGRNFTYDSLSRLIQSFNPETGWTCYGTAGSAAPNGRNCTGGYDANGNLSLKTDARAVVTSYSYDSLNRVLSKNYVSDAAATPSSCYQYDSVLIGHLSRLWTQRYSAGACAAGTGGFLTKRDITAYDPMGRVLSEQQYTLASQAGGTSYPLTYKYDLAGNLYTSTNGSTPTPITFTYVFSTAGRLQTLGSSGINGEFYPGTLFSAQSATSIPCPNSQSYAYAPSGGLMNAQLGSGLTLNRAYDKRWRTTCEKDLGNGATDATPGSTSVTISGSEQSR